MRFSYSAPAAIAFVCLLVGPLAGCRDTAPIRPDLTDAGPLPDSGSDPIPDAGSALDAGADAGTSCPEGAREIRWGDLGFRATGLAPLGDGWAISIEDETQAAAFVRLTADGAVSGSPIPLERGDRWIGRGAIAMRALGRGVLVRSGNGLRFFLPNGEEPHAPLEDLGRLVLGPSTGNAVLAISGNDVIRITESRTLAVERFPTGLDLTEYEEPTFGYVTYRTAGVSADGCLALSALGYDPESPSTVRTLPVIPGASCSDASHDLPRLGSIGAFDSLADGRFVTVAALFPTDEPTRSQIAQLYEIGGEDVIAGGEPFGDVLYYGARAAIASAPDRTVIATTAAYASDGGTVWFWNAADLGPLGADGRSARTAVYLAWHPALDRIAALYGLDASGSNELEHTLGFRCDL